MLRGHGRTRGVPQVVVPEMCPRCARGVPQVVVPEIVPRCARCARDVPEVPGVPQVCIGRLPSYRKRNRSVSSSIKNTCSTKKSMKTSCKMGISHGRISINLKTPIKKSQYLTSSI